MSPRTRAAGRRRAPRRARAQVVSRWESRTVASARSRSARSQLAGAFVPGRGGLSIGDLDADDLFHLCLAEAAALDLGRANARDRTGELRVRSPRSAEVRVPGPRTRGRRLSSPGPATPRAGSQHQWRGAATQDQWTPGAGTGIGDHRGPGSSVDGLRDRVPGPICRVRRPTCRSRSWPSADGSVDGSGVVDCGHGRSQCRHAGRSRAFIAAGRLGSAGPGGCRRPSWSPRLLAPAHRARAGVLEGGRGGAPRPRRQDSQSGRWQARW